MAKKLLAFLLVVVVLVSSMSTVIISVAAATETKQTLNISVVTTKTDNDLLTTLQANYDGIKHYTTLDAALADVETNITKGIMVLADNYPNSTTAITDAQATTINNLGVRLYVEFPTNNETLGITGFGTASAVGSMYYDRAVVVDAEAVGMDEYSLLYVHGAKYLKKEDTTNSWLVNAKVAGYDVADFGLEGCVAETDTSLWIVRQNHVPYSMLETNASGNVLICSTKFSQFITARYAPYVRWNTLWLSILSWVAQSEVTSIEWTPSVNANYGKTDTLSADAYTTAVDLNAQWYINNMLPAADGSAGVYQCYNSGYAFNAYGEQSLNAGVRADCTGESIGALAIAGAALNNEEYKNIAYNAMNWMLNESNMANLDRADPTSPHYGLFSWYDDNNGTDSYYTTYLKSYYGDDNAKAILGLILGAAALETDEFDERILEAILANFRTTGTNGFRGNHIGSELDTNGWEYYYNKATTNYASHFESLLWACYLWAYEKTGYEPLLERTKTAISMMMTAYDHTMNDNDEDSSGEWNWTNGLQADRAKLIWPLAWLVRIEPTEEHIGWLDLMITDMMKYQDAETGALRDVIGDVTQGKGSCGSFTNNVDYGRYESPVIQNNGDPCSDSLYAASFAMVALNEAYAAMASINADTAAKYQQYAKSLSDYHVRIQQVSDNTKYNGVWFRGFDYEKWETYGSDGDAGWGIWVTETGWSQAQISSALSLQTLGTNIWDYSKGSTVNTYFNDTATTMLGTYYTEPQAEITSDVALRWDAGVLVNGEYADADPTKWSTGKWTGAEGQDITLTIDYGQNKTFDSVTIGFDQLMSVGACIPASITVYASNDGTAYNQVGYYATNIDVQAKYDAWYNNGTNNSSELYIDRIKTPMDDTVTARYVKIVIENPGTFTHAAHGAGTKTWMFMDEIELGLTTYSMEELKALIDTAEATSVDGKQPATVLALDEALQAALEHYNSNSNNTLERKNVYEALESAIAGLKDATDYSFVSASPTNGVSWVTNPDVKITDGNHTTIASGWKVLTDLTNLTEQEIEVILDMQETVGVLSVGYSAQSYPKSGIYMQNAKYYVSDSTDGEWTYVGEVAGTAHKGDPSVAEYQTVTAAANGSEGRYVKVVFSRCDAYEQSVTMSPNRSEWLYLTEILINEFRPINVTTKNATVDMSYVDGTEMEIGLLGAIYAKDVAVNVTPDENALPTTVTVNGSDAVLSNNSFIIENITEEQNVVVKYSIFAAEDLPKITGVKDLFVAASDVASFDPRVDIAAYDKDGNDITSSVTYNASTLSATAGTYTVSYKVVASNGASAQATANVHVVDSLNAKHVVATTPSAADVGSSRNQMNKAQILLDGTYAPSGATHSDPQYLPWK
ncbi:MAG: hypothetical protein IJY79_04825, partial [Clostridia bacterium]|nr:hypothetical protein [Clostridia bacterium]